MGILGSVRRLVRRIMGEVAAWLHKVTNGKLSPNTVTITGLLAHIPIAWLIVVRHPFWAAFFLAVFGLFDTLDGELARLQKRASAYGMLLDSVTDRVKEILLYSAAAYNVIDITGRPFLAVWAVAACGTSLLVGYVNAWGEAVVSRRVSAEHYLNLNKSFRVGMGSFEVRMGIFLIGLLSGRVTLAMIVITTIASLTAFQRFMHVSGKLKDV